MLGLCALHLSSQQWPSFTRWNNGQSFSAVTTNIPSNFPPTTEDALDPAPSVQICQNLCAIKQTFTGNFKYIHLYGHMDRYLEWEQQTLIQQLNCVCAVPLSKNKQYQQPLSTAATAGSLSSFLEKMWR